MSEATQTGALNPPATQTSASPLEPFQVHLLESSGRSVLVLSGVLGAEAAMEIQGCAQQILAANQDLHLDLSGVEHLSAASLQVLLAAGLDVSRQGRSLHVCGSNDTVRQLLELAGVAERFPSGERKE